MMDVTDGTPELPQQTGIIPPGSSVLVKEGMAPLHAVPVQPKKRNTKHYKAIARAAEKLAADRLTQVEDARAVSEIWRNTNTINYRLMLACGGVAIAGWLTVGWLAFWHYKP